MNLHAFLRAICQLGTLSMLIGSPLIKAEEVTYAVNLSGTDADSGRMLAVKGTITANIDTNLISGHSLFFFRDGNQLGVGPLALSADTATPNPWNANQHELIFMGELDEGAIVWSGRSLPIRRDLWQLKLSNDSSLYWVTSGSRPIRYEYFFPQGDILVGTAIPEPGTLLMCTTSLFLVNSNRRRLRRP